MRDDLPAGVDLPPHGDRAARHRGDLAGQEVATCGHDAQLRRDGKRDDRPGDAVRSQTVERLPLWLDRHGACTRDVRERPPGARTDSPLQDGALYAVGARADRDLVAEEHARTAEADGEIADVEPRRRETELAAERVRVDRPGADP